MDYKKWFLISTSKQETITYLRVLRLYGVHFENNQYKTSER